MPSARAPENRPSAKSPAGPDPAGIRVSAVRKLELATVIRRDLWEIGYKKKAPAPKPPSAAPAQPKTMSFLAFGGSGLGALALIGLAVLASRRRRA